MALLNVSREANAGLDIVRCLGCSDLYLRIGELVHTSYGHVHPEE